jgi:hypothetical protein
MVSWMPPRAKPIRPLVPSSLASHETLKPSVSA